MTFIIIIWIEYRKKRQLLWFKTKYRRNNFLLLNIFLGHSFKLVNDIWDSTFCTQSDIYLKLYKINVERFTKQSISTSKYMWIFNVHKHTYRIISKERLKSDNLDNTLTWFTSIFMCVWVVPYYIIIGLSSEGVGSFCFYMHKSLHYNNNKKSINQIM